MTTSGSRVGRTTRPSIPSSFQVTARQPGLFGLLLDTAEGNTLVEPLGTLLLSPSFVPFATGATPGSVPLPLPSVPGWAGTTFHFQAVTLSFAYPAVLTSALTATLF